MSRAPKPNDLTPHRAYRIESRHLFTVKEESHSLRFYFFLHTVFLFALRPVRIRSGPPKSPIRTENPDVPAFGNQIGALPEVKLSSDAVQHLQTYRKKLRSPLLVQNKCAVNPKCVWFFTKNCWKKDSPVTSRLRVSGRAPVYILMKVMLEERKQERDFFPHRPLLTIQAALG